MRRKLLFASLYLSEGAPIGFIWWALPAQLRAAGLDLGRITALTGLLVLPWALKFLWAPLVDVLRSTRWPLRAWIASCQVLMGLLLLAALRLDWKDDYGLTVILLLLHALCAATQDAAVDAYAVAVVPPEERGSLNGWMQAGMLVGRSLFGGGALLMASRLGSSATALLLVAAIWSSLLLLFLLGEPEPARAPEETLSQRLGGFASALAEVLRRRGTWLGLAFAALGGAGFEAVGAVAGPYLLDRGLSQDRVGWFLFLPAAASMLAGSLAAGTLADRVERKRAVALSLLLTSLTVLALAGLEAWGKNPGRCLPALLGLLYFFIGAFTASSYALFMDLTDARLGATQFSAYMGATNLCEAWAAFGTGKLAVGLGYAPAFALMALVSLACLPLLSLMPASEKRRSAAG